MAALQNSQAGTKSNENPATNMTASTAAASPNRTAAASPNRTAAASPNRTAAASAEQAIALLRRQVARLAVTVNASQLLDPATLDLTAIDDCGELRTRGLPAGTYFLRPHRRAVLCTEAGELLVLRRTNGAVNFNASWAAYRSGLGKAESGDFFLGLDFLANFTRDRDVCMRLQLTPWKLPTERRDAVYDSFRVGSRQDRFRLSYAAFSGSLLSDVLSIAKERPFSTYDRDNDQFVGNCAATLGGGNWYASCQHLNVFGTFRGRKTASFCSRGLDKSLGDTCSPLTAAVMLLKTKSNTKGARKIVFAAIAPKSGCTASLELFTVPATSLYTVTIGGAPGGETMFKNPVPGGRGARIRAEFFWRKGEIIGASAGCSGINYGKASAGRGGDASWLVHRSRKLLLVVAGGGGGGGET